MLTNGKNGLLINPQQEQEYVEAVHSLESVETRYHYGISAKNSLTRHSSDEIYRRTIGNYSKTIKSMSMVDCKINPNAVRTKKISFL